MKHVDFAWLPLNALRALVAVHETGSVGEAAQALKVTHGAVSQQLRSLEARLERRLFTRTGNRLVMTPETQELAGALLGHFQAIASEVDQFRRDDHMLNITVTPHFAQHWLMPRLGALLQRHPELDLRINTDAAVHDLIHGDFDAAVRHGKGDWPGLRCEQLLEGWDVVVAAPSLLETATIKSPRDLTALHWILDEDREAEMASWFKDHDIAHRDHTRITRLPSALTLVAALDGHGVAWLPHVYAAPYLASGRLVQVLRDDEEAQPRSRHYYLCWAEAKNRPALRTFRQWIRQQLAR